MNQPDSSVSPSPVKIHIVIPSRNMVGHTICGGLSAALHKMQQDPRYRLTIKMMSGFGLDVVRNRIVADFLNTDAEFLLMIDDDLVPPDDLLAMAGHNCDIVGALCYGWQNVSGPFIVAYSQDEQGRWRRPALGAIEKTGLHEVALVGGGCMMLHRRVFSKLAPPWFYFDIDAAGQTVLSSEDFVFCKNARQQGLQVFLDSDRICGHIKEVDLRDVVTLSLNKRKNPLFTLLE